MFITDIQTCCIKKVKSLCCNLFSGEFFHLFFVLEGNGKLICDGSSKPFTQNDCFFFPTFQQLETVPAKDTHASLVHIIFKTNNMQLQQLLLKTEGKLSVSGKSARHSVLSILNAFAVRPEYYQDSVNLNMIKLLYYGITRLSEQSDGGFGAELEQEGCIDPILKRLIDYIDLNLTEDFLMEQLCRLVNRSRKQINNLFKQYYNYTALQWIHLRRLSKSKELLSFSNYSVTEIAELTGFKSIHYFSRFFKEKEQITPLEYRENVGYSLASDDLS